jgi:hypothetical protein
MINLKHEFTFPPFHLQKHISIEEHDTLVTLSPQQGHAEVQSDKDSLQLSLHSAHVLGQHVPQTTTQQITKTLEHIESAQADVARAEIKVQTYQKHGLETGVGSINGRSLPIISIKIGRLKI